MTREISDDLPAIEGDPKRLQQVLGNVISNAIKFTPEQGTVPVRTRRRAATGWSIEVEDSGAGIAPDLLPFIFDRFRQGDSRSTRRHGGLGLGLAIARHLVELHGGDIDAHSDGAGTRYDVSHSPADCGAARRQWTAASVADSEKRRSICPAATCSSWTTSRIRASCWCACCINGAPRCCNVHRLTPR